MINTRRTRLFVVGAVILLAVLCPRFPHAEDSWDTSAYKDWTVSDVVIDGLDEKMAADLKGGFALALTTGFLGTKRPLFFPQTLEEDLNRARLFLARRGYPFAQISVRFEPDHKAQKIVVIFDVDKGPPVHIASVTVTGLPADLEKKSNESVLTKPKMVFADRDVEGTVEALSLLLGENGYAHAVVESDVKSIDSTNVDVFFNAVPGTAFYFGTIIVKGADDDIAPLVEKSVSAKDGKRYDPKLLDDSQKNLRVLGLFRQIRFDFEEAAVDTLNVIVDVTMREPYRFEAGVRYWSDEGLDGGARWTHRNLFKRGRGGSVLGSASSFLQRVEFSAWWPAILVAKSRLSGTVGVRRETEESYTQLDTGGDVTLSYNFSLRSRVLVGLLLSNVDVIEKSDDVITDLEQDGLLAAWSFLAEQDRGNDPILPTRGTFTRIRFEWAPKYGWTDYHYLKVEPTISAYMGVPRTEQTVFAVRLTVGGAEPFGKSTDLLPSKRFFSGGATSMRGFKRRKLGPLDSDGAPLGGEALFETSGELRFPLFWRFRGTTFVDAGQVWPRIEDITADNIEVAVGSGLWISTLIGPLRGDLAYRLTYHETTQPRWVFHFSIGPAF